MYLRNGHPLRTAPIRRRPKERLAREVYMRPKDRERLRTLRLKQNLTQRQLAVLCKCTQAAISGLETGRMPNASKDLAKQICRWLERDLDELFTEHEGISSVRRVTNAAGSKRSVEKVPA